MAVETRQLRIKARKLGATNVREMSRDELEDYIAEHSNGNGKKVKGKKATKAIKATGKNKVKRGRPRKVVEDDDDDEDEDVAPRKRGRPKGSTNKATKKSGRGPGRPPKAESERKQSRKASTAKKGAVGRPPGSGSGTRVSVPDVIKWNKDFDFREGSTAQYILNALRKAANKRDETADIREATFDKLVEKINKVDELTFNNRATGKPHKGEKAEQMLRYRINRTIFDYAVETGQHDADGGSAKKSSKSNKTSTSGKNNVKRGPGRPRKVVEDDEDDDEEVAPKKRGRPKGSTNKTGVKRGRPKGSKNKVVEEEKPRRGRPPGSKNKTTNKVAGKKRGRPKGSKNRA